MSGRCTGDAGQAGGLEVLPFGILTFVSLSLVVCNAWAVVDAKFATDAAAREAARAFVEATGVREADAYASALEDAVSAGREAFVAHGNRAERLTIELVVDPARGFARCTRAVFEASSEVPALTVPFLGGFGSSVSVRSTHSELVDPFRDGVPGEVAC